MTFLRKQSGETVEAVNELNFSGGESLRGGLQEATVQSRPLTGGEQGLGAWR